MRLGTLLRWHALKNILKSEITDSSTIIDLGGYDGFISSNLKKFFPALNITVVDTDKKGMKLAEKKGLNTLRASALELPIENNKIDVVLCLDLIEHIKEDDKVISEISRVLKKGGKVILTTPVSDGLTLPFFSKEKNEKFNKNLGHIRKGYSLEKIKKLFNANQLTILKTSKYFNLFSRLVYWSMASGIRLKGKGLLYRLIIRLEPYIKYRAQEHIIIGKKKQ